MTPTLGTKNLSVLQQMPHRIDSNFSGNSGSEIIPPIITSSNAGSQPRPKESKDTNIIGLRP